MQTECALHCGAFTDQLDTLVENTTLNCAQYGTFNLNHVVPVRSIDAGNVLKVTCAV